jgi:Zn-dependent protease with chaperone function
VLSRVDTANRSFAALLAVVIGAAIVAGLIGCCVIAVVTYRFGQDGLSAIDKPGTLPALVLLALFGSGAVLGSRALRRQSRGTVRLGRRVRRYTRRPVPERLLSAADAHGLGGRIDLIDAPEPCSFTYGLTRPRVAVSTGLLERVDDEELAAVLVHERYHVSNWDPAKVFLTRTLPRVFPYLPVLDALHDRYLTSRELAADRRAIEQCGARPLTSALLKVVAGPDWADLRAAAAIGGDEALDARITQLEEDREPRMSPLGRARLGLTVFGGGALVWSVFATLAAFGGPGELMRTLCTG